MQINKSYRRNLHTVEKDYIPQGIIDAENRKKTWKYGFNHGYDMVVISKDGTIGEIVNINGLKIALPSAPKTVWNQNLKHKDQKWKRFDVPEELSDFDKIFSDSENVEEDLIRIHKKHIKFIQEDFDKIKNGMHFYNDGNLVYITGYNYFFLQHYKLTDMRRYADFRMPQRDYFLWVEACFADDRCLGSLYLKNRRSFFSVCSGSIVIAKAIRTRNGSFPVVSKTEDDAKKVFANHIVTPFINLPKHLQPQRSGEVKPKKELEFTAPKKKITVNNKTDNSNDGLDTLITYLASVVDAYDGWQVTISINDEIGKFKYTNINEYWEQAHKMCHAVGNEIVGKALCGSTANPPNKGGKNYREFYDNSKLETRDITNQTRTGLYALFIPADLMQMGFYDEWGYAVYDDPEIPIKNELGKEIKIGAKSYLDNKEIACGGDIQKLNAQKRNHPRVETDAFLDEDATSMFGTEGVVNHKNFLKQYKYTEKYKTSVFRFDLHWKNGIADGEVEMVRSKFGRFACSWLPPKELRNVVKEDGKHKYPVNSHLGALGCDPYDADKTKYANGSKMGFKGLTKNNQFDLTERERCKMFLHYNHRPDTKEEAEEDIIKAIVYLSMPILPEINKKSLVEKLYKRGYRKFVLNNPLKLKKDLSPDELKYGGISSHGTNIPEQQNALESWIKDNIPVSVDEDDLKVPFEDALEDAELYTREDRQKRDGTVAWMYAVLATSDVIQPPKELSTANTEVNFTELFSVNK